MPGDFVGQQACGNTAGHFAVKRVAGSFAELHAARCHGTATVRSAAARAAHFGGTQAELSVGYRTAGYDNTSAACCY